MSNKTKTSGERMAVIETDINYIKSEVTGIRSKMDSFINHADHKYATKEELCELKAQNNTHVKSSSELVKWGISFIVSLIAIIIAMFFR